MRQLFVALFALAMIAAAGCQQKEPPLTDTKGNATDRNPANGTSGTGEPASVATDTANAAQQLGTVAPSQANGTVAITGTEDVHAAKTETTSTIKGPAGTSTVSVATPTGTTSTVAAPKEPKKKP